MDVALDTHLQAFVTSLAEDRRFGSSAAVVEAALRLLEEREEKRLQLAAAIDAALLRGGSHSDDEVADAVAARLAALPLPDAAE